MMNRYSLQLEQIIKEMNADIASGRTDAVNSDYSLWLNFLKQIHPESELLNGQQQEFSGDPSFGKDPKQFFDIREIMMLAEAKQYPVWFIQPRFNEVFILEYERGMLKNMFLNRNGNMETQTIREAPSIPKTIEGFNGRISGSLYQDETNESKFIASDVDRIMSFSQKMELLKNAGFMIAEFVLFPTNKIPTISSSKLETFFQNYISKAQIQGLNVDGVVMISDTPLVTEDRRVHSMRIAYAPIQPSIHH